MAAADYSYGCLLDFETGVVVRKLLEPLDRGVQAIAVSNDGGSPRGWAAV